MSNQIPSINNLGEAEEGRLNRSLEQLQKHYKKHSQELPDNSIDRQIMAAAQREILVPNKKEKLKNSLWRKLSLPLYATATFAFTALAIHVLLPEPVRVPPGTSAGPVSIEVINEDDVSEQLLKQNSLNGNSEPRESWLVPNVELQQPLPPFPITEIEIKGEEKLQSEDLIGKYLSSQLNLQIQGSLNNQQNFPDKEVWAREIINLFKNGDHQKAQNELNRFKQIFPDYPIDEQTEAFKH